jgi:hypothetical protein
MVPLVLIGYFPKKAHFPDWLNWLNAHGVTAIGSVCQCSSSGPDNWVDHWTHNELWVYSSIAAAVAVVPQAERGDYELHAYRMLAVQWDEGIETPVALPPLDVQPLPGDFQSIGFDAVSREKGTTAFGHSPLSCNGMAQKIPTNQHCLLDSIEDAKRTALEFSRGNVEPGPYFVVEVLRRVALV